MPPPGRRGRRVARARRTPSEPLTAVARCGNIGRGGAGRADGAWTIMNLNDPFGRVAQRREAHYAALRDALVASGVDTPGAARELLGTIRRRALAYSVTVLLATGVLLLLFPAAAAVTVVLAVVLLLWIVSTSVHSRRHVERYAAELARRQDD